LQRKTKILCTIGPASASPEVLRRMIESGMDAARINFSHGNREELLGYLRDVRRAAAEIGKPLAVLGDLQGPKIRIGIIGGSGKVELTPGARLVIDPAVETGDAERVGTSYKTLAGDLSPGAMILLDDGLIRLVVEEIKGRAVYCRVVVGGVLKSHKGLNLPGVKVNIPALTPKDEEDLALMIEHGFDYAALSFVQSAEDIRRMKELIRKTGGDIKIVAKIEKPAALDHLEEILAEVDGVMVARGDLGVELSVERVPSAQKNILRSASRAKVLSITATQMLESMTVKPVPTRAEASDVANAVFDLTDALMLSGETAVGDYPVQTVAMAAAIAIEAEKAMESWSDPRLLRHRTRANIPDAICHAVADAARDLGAKAIVIGSQSGQTALLMSKFRPQMPIIGISSDERTVNRMALMNGVCPVQLPSMNELEESISLAVKHLLSVGFANDGDIVMMTFGAPLQGRGRTNMLRIIQVGEKCTPVE